METVWIYYGFSDAIANSIVWISLFFPVCSFMTTTAIKRGIIIIFSHHQNPGFHICHSYVIRSTPKTNSDQFNFVRKQNASTI